MQGNTKGSSKPTSLPPLQGSGGELLSYAALPLLWKEAVSMTWTPDLSVTKKQHFHYAKARPTCREILSSLILLFSIFLFLPSKYKLISYTLEYIISDSKSRFPTDHFIVMGIHLGAPSNWSRSNSYFLSSAMESDGESSPKTYKTGGQGSQAIIQKLALEKHFV